MTLHNPEPQPLILVDQEAVGVASRAQIDNLLARQQAVNPTETFVQQAEREIADRRRQAHEDIASRYDNQPSLARRLIVKAFGQQG